MRRLETDVLVIGGGPAGSVTASLLRKYNPRLRVVLVEQATFPRYHIGESLVLEVNRVLADAGVLDAVKEAGFLKKGGAAYVWGEDRRPWAFLFAESTGRRPHFEGALDYTFHVDRAEFDRILIDHAKKLGVDVHQPARVVAVASEEGKSPSVVEVELDGGEHVSIEARFVVDASGRAGLVSRRHGKRIFDPILKNIATFGYWKGVTLEKEYSRDWDLATISIVSMPMGWMWFIPMSPGVVSVGVVTPVDKHREYARADVEDFYRSSVFSAPEPSRWLKDTELFHLPGAPKKVMVESDFNYLQERLHGPGWAAVGDAAGFLDPLFTFGVFLSVTGAQLLAYAIGTFLDGRYPGATEERLLGAYEQHMRGYFGAFRAMLYTFYGFNSTKEDLWRQTREQMRAHALPPDVADRDAFMAMTFGFGINSMLFQEATSHFGKVAMNRIRGMLLDGSDAKVELNQMGDWDTTSLPDDARPKVIAPYTLASSAIPIEGTGRMVAMSRVDFMVPSRHGAAFPRSYYMPDAWLPMLEQMNGQTTVRDLVAAASARAVPPYLRHVKVDRFVDHTLRATVGMGVVEPNVPAGAQ
jgi:flavin-dependent dehydrogenase